ncbi:MAG: cysteine-rich CWC family protein [Bacteroidia bacterium]
MSIKKCSRCSTDFECCNEKPGCWCENLFIDIETLNKLKKEYDNCLCSSCLKEYANSNNISKK